MGTSECKECGKEFFHLLEESDYCFDRLEEMEGRE